MSALEKILASRTQAESEDPASELVTAAASALDELLVILASDDEDDDSSDDDDEDDGDGDDDSKAARFKAMLAKKKGKKKGKAAKSAKCAALAAGARIALAGLASAPEDYDWVEATSAPLTPAEAMALTSVDTVNGYADPGFRGRKRYPIDAKHINATVAYFSQSSKRGEYSTDQARIIWNSIKAAADQHGLQGAMLELAAAEGDGGLAFHHGPFQGKHSHAHVGAVVHSHAHNHNNDARHDCGGGMGRDW